MALRPRLSPGVPLSWDWQSELQSGAEAVKRPAGGSKRVSSGHVRSRKQRARHRLTCGRSVVNPPLRGKLRQPGRTARVARHVGSARRRKSPRAAHEPARGSTLHFHVGRLWTRSRLATMPSRSSRSTAASRSLHACSVASGFAHRVPHIPGHLEPPAWQGDDVEPKVAVEVQAGNGACDMEHSAQPES